MDIDFEQILGLSPNPYVLLDRNLVMVWMNEAYLRATMREREAITGRKMFDAFPSDGESFQLLASSLNRVLDTGEIDEIALIRYDIKGRDGNIDVRYWSATHTPICEDGEIRYILQHTVDVTEVEELRQARDEMGIIRRAKTVQAENRTLKDEAKALDDYFEHAPSFTAVLFGPEHRFGMANQAYRRLISRENLIGRTVAEVLPEVVEQGFTTLLDRVYESGEAYFGQQEEVLLVPEGAKEPATFFLNFVYQPIFDDDGSVRGIIVQGHDVTEEVLSLQRQGLLVNELNHRVKNTLSIVQGLATQSLRGRETEAGRQIFDARLRALAAAHNLLTEGFWAEARVEDIVKVAAEAAIGDAIARMDLGGDRVNLAPQAAVSLAMVVHELCTNALKYGALSNEAGKVTVRWSIEPGADGIFTFAWTETGGPTVSAPERKGFGTRLISRGIGDRSDDGVEIAFEPDGLQLSMQARSVRK